MMFSNRKSPSISADCTYSNGNIQSQHLLATNSSYHFHYKSTPNVATFFDDQMEQRRLSDGASLRLPNHNLYYPGEFGGSEQCMLNKKNSSLSMLLDSTSSLMRTASTSLHYLIGSARRASYCGEPDPTIQLSPCGNSGSLYLLPATACSNESSLSNASFEEQRRTVTIYDGRIPAAPSTPIIPFELMAPIDVITQTNEDPVESFVQIVLEEPDDRPPILTPPTSSRRNSGSTHSHRHRHRRNSSNSSLVNGQMLPTDAELVNTRTEPVKDLFNSSEVYYQPPAVVEPMDFSFLEPVLRGESAAPPQIHKPAFPQKRSTSEDLALDLRPPSRFITIMKDDVILSDFSSGINNDDYSTNHSLVSSSLLKVPSYDD